MGATLKHSINQPSHTENLCNWIMKVRSKKIKCRRWRKRNLKIEAVLNYALSKAENNLRNEQMMRLNKCQQVKDETTNNQQDSKEAEKLSNSVFDKVEDNVWEAPLCSELSSLDDFMSMLKQIKAPLQR